MPVPGKRQPPRGNEEKVMLVGDADMLEEAAGGGESELRLAGERGVTRPAAAGEAKLEKITAERDAYLELARRERADFDNYRKRVEREIKQIKRDSLADFLREFFAPLDDMDRVLLEGARSASVDSLLTGVRIMQENFWKVLAKAGVEKIDALGKPFDPALHEAMTVVSSREAPPNTVVEVYTNGYRIDDFILRPAKVVVSRSPET
jgi:molecular chaperone GrpE